MLQVHDGGVTLCYRYMMEVLGCGRYLARQSSHFTAGSVVAILTAHSFFAENPAPVVQQVCAASQEEGQSVGKGLNFILWYFAFFFFAMGDFTGRGVAVTGVAAPRRSPLLLCRP